jgi:hypothetical protein
MLSYIILAKKDASNFTQEKFAIGIQCNPKYTGKSKVNVKLPRLTQSHNE